jgi:DNA replication initiation complex subunit (GINS family)
MELSYDELRRIHRLEKNASGLVLLEENFLNDLQEFIEEEKKNYLSSLKDFSIANTRSFSNTKKIVEEIFSLREKKILNHALVASKTGDTHFENLTESETKLFKSILEELVYHNRMIETFFTGKQKKNTTGQRDLNKVLVKTLSQVPMFVGTDMKEYGPLEKGETATLPKKVAEILVSRKMAQIQE